MGRLWLVCAALALAGCVTDSTVVQSSRYYPDYRAALADIAARGVLQGPYASAPNRVRAVYADCAASFAVGHLTAQQASKLDAYVQGKSDMTVGEFKAIDQAVIQQSGGPLTYATLDRLAGTCPNDVADFKRYFGPGFNGL